MITGIRLSQIVELRSDSFSLFCINIIVLHESNSELTSKRWVIPQSFEPHLPSVVLTEQPWWFLAFCHFVGYSLKYFVTCFAYHCLREIISFTDHMICSPICPVQRPVVVVVVVPVFCVSVVVVAVSCFFYYAAVLRPCYASCPSVC